MIKETFYFSHDYNAQSDEKILKLRRKLWLEWYWIYWCIIERLASNDWILHLKSVDDIAYDLHIDNSVITQLLTEFDLFIIDKEKWIFYNKRLMKNFDFREEKRKRKSEAWKKWMLKRRWNKEKDNIVITEKKIDITENNKGKERKGKERKEKERKVNRISFQEIFTQNLDDDFKKDLLQKYENDILNTEMLEFISYRTEKNHNWKKEKREKQKTFDIKRRFRVWLQNNYRNNNYSSWGKWILCEE